MRRTPPEDTEPFPVYDHSSDPDFGIEEEEQELPLQRHSLRTRRPVFYGVPTSRKYVPSDSDSDSDSFVAKKQLARRKRASSRTQSPASTSKKRKPKRRPVVLLPEDVPWKEPRKENPDVTDASVSTISQSPSVAFLVIFIQTFADLFSDFPEIVGPREIEQGLVTPVPSALMERLFVRLLGLVLNRKKEVEIGRYGSALSELHAQLSHLGVGDAFPPLNWKSKDAFSELATWEDRLELLHVLVHWSLANSERVRTLLSGLDEEYAKPWIGVGPDNTKYYLVEGANEMRVYRETSTLLSVVVWKEVASTSEGVKELVRGLWPSLIPPPPVVVEATPTAGGSAEPVAPKSEIANAPDTEVKAEGEGEGEAEAEAEEDVKEEENDADLTEAELATKTLARALLDLVPEFEAQEAVRIREARRLKRRDELARHAEFLRQGGARTRTRRTEIDFAKMFADPESDSDDSSRRKPRGRHSLRTRDNGWEPKQEKLVVEESREERYARLEKARAARAETEEEHDTTEEPVETPVPSVEPITVSAPSPAQPVPQPQISLQAEQPEPPLVAAGHQLPVPVAQPPQPQPQPAAAPQSQVLPSPVLQSSSGPVLQSPSAHAQQPIPHVSAPAGQPVLPSPLGQSSVLHQSPVLAQPVLQQSPAASQAVLPALGNQQVPPLQAQVPTQVPPQQFGAPQLVPTQANGPQQFDATQPGANKLFPVQQHPLLSHNQLPPPQSQPQPQSQSPQQQPQQPHGQFQNQFQPGQNYSPMGQQAPVANLPPLTKFMPPTGPVPGYAPGSYSYPVPQTNQMNPGPGVQQFPPPMQQNGGQNAPQNGQPGPGA